MGIYFIIINIVTFFTMYLDKRKSQKNKWRIPEKRIWLLACIGGATGGMIGMYTFRHKTKHRIFVYLLPILSLLQGFIIGYLVFRSEDVISQVLDFIR